MLDNNQSVPLAHHFGSEYTERSKKLNQLLQLVKWGRGKGKNKQKNPGNAQNLSKKMFPFYIVNDLKYWTFFFSISSFLPANCFCFFGLLALIIFIANGFYFHFD